MPRFCVLTVSDRCSRGEAVDKSGPLLVEKVEQHFGLEQAGEEGVVLECVADEVAQIRAAVRRFVAGGARLVITTGGTGLTPRDVTPEALKPMYDRETPGFNAAITNSSLAVTPMAMLSRPSCGIIGSALVLTFPGSAKACAECFGFVQRAMNHAIDSIGNDTEKVRSTCKSVQAAEHHHGHHHHNHSHNHHHDSSKNHSHEHKHGCSHGHKHGHTHSHKHGHTHEHHQTSATSRRSVADRDRKSVWPMMKVPEAIDLMLSTIAPLEPVKVPLLSSVGLVLAEDVVAAEPHPRFPASIKDGYAVVAKDCPETVQVVSSVLAGDTEDQAELQPGTCVRITTGAPVPPGATAVIMVEDTELVAKTEDGEEEKEIKLLCARPIPEGQDIRPIGFDICEGEVVLKRGQLIAPAELGVLATLGVSEVLVYRKPVVGVISTGDELVDAATPAEKMKYGQVRDSNRHSVLATLAAKNVEGKDFGVLTDKEEELIAALAKLIQECDILITSGGVSMGEKDLIKGAVATLGGKVHFGRVFMKPGKPTTFATIPKQNSDGQCLFFGLPGNPVSCIVTLNLFVIPALRKLLGVASPKHRLHRVALGFEHTLSPRPEYHRAVFADDEPRVSGEEEGAVRSIAAGLRRTPSVVISTGSQCSSRLTSLRAAEALLVLPSCNDVDDKFLPKGTIVDAILL